MKSVYPSEGSSLVVIQSGMLSACSNLKHGVSTRVGGVSRGSYGLNVSFNVGDQKEDVEKNRSRFFKALEVPPEQLAVPQQRHTANVMVVTSPGHYENCDALVTNVAGVYLSVTVADCAPVFLFDGRKRVVGCVHAGWRGTQQRIVRKAVDVLVAQFGTDPADVLAYIGPRAGACCYEVGEEVATQFDETALSRSDGKIHLDIGKANADQLRGAGIPDRNVEVLQDCTICSNDLYHSYRREREASGRMMALIGMNQ